MISIFLLLGSYFSEVTKEKFISLGVKLMLFSLAFHIIILMITDFPGGDGGPGMLWSLTGVYIGIPVFICGVIMFYILHKFGIANKDK